MRRSLIWTLAASGIASAVAVWLEPGDKASSGVIAARASAGPDSGATPAAANSSDRYANWRDATAAPAPGASGVGAPLPSALPDRDVEAGRRDIFTPVTPPPPPPMNWRALGSMVTPAGERIVWLARGNDEITVKPGAVLDDGYVVQSIDKETVVLLYPPIGTTARISLPHAQAGSP